MKKMYWRIILFIITYQQMSLTIRITTINNAIFDPVDTNYWLANLSNIVSRDSCSCQCYARSNCVTANYYGQRQECILFSASLRYEQLRVATISESTTVISFNNISNVDAATTQNSNTITTAHTTVITTHPTTSTLTTVASYSCTAATNYSIGYTTTPASYQKQTYNYTALSTSIITLEFGFKAKNSAKTWHLDDVSVLDTTANNSEMLVNGGFESGTLVGWQVLCSTENCGGTGGVIDQSSCHTGSYCYEGTCRDAYDFLRQKFTGTIGHVYMLTFWLYTDGHNAQAGYVKIG